MHPLAPSHAPCALVDQTEVVRQRRRRGRPRLATLMRVMVVLASMAGVTAGVLWLKHETPHPEAVEATRESPLVEARSLQPLLETARPSEMEAYAMNKAQAPSATVALTSVQLLAPPATSRVLPVWLLADAPEFADTVNRASSREQTLDALRQSLRDRGARQMGVSVRFAVLNLAELLGMNTTSWAASQATPAAGENRASALLLTFYLHHLDRAGDAAGVKALIRAMQQGMPEQQAVREFILAGRSVADIEREMRLAFEGAGVELQFTRRGGAMFRP